MTDHSELTTVMSGDDGTWTIMLGSTPVAVIMPYGDYVQMVEELDQWQNDSET